mgnify:CR=1 FL=1
MEETTLKMHTDVSEMKGMLTTALANHTAQLVAQEGRINTIVEAQGVVAGKVSELSGTVSGIEKEIIGVKSNIDTNRTESKHNHDKDITELKAAQAGTLMKVMGVLGPILALSSIALVVIKDIYGG